jgi:hypothetical protein
MKKTLKIAIIILAAGGLSLWLANYLTMGKVVISSSDTQAEVTLTKIGNTQFSKSGTGYLSLKLRSGRYVAVVAGNSQGASQIIDVKARKTVRYNLTPPPTVGVEPVVDIGGSYMAASREQLFYIDNASQNLYKIDSQNKVSLVDDAHRLISAKWASATEGLAEDTNNHLYAIKDGGVSALTLPVSSVGSYDIAADQSVYFSHNNDIYKGSLGGNFSKIYTAKNPFTSLSASIKGVAVISSPSADNTKSYKNNVTFVSSGQTISKDISVYASSAWSPGGRYFASAGNADYKIYDNSLGEIADIPNVAISSPLWTSDSSLIYSVKDQLWEYDLSTGKSVQIANMPLGATVSQLSLSDDKAYVYASVAGLNGSSGSMKRVSLNKMPVPKIVYQLQDVLPIDEEGCTFLLVNFTAPVVTVLPASAGQSQICLQNAGLELSQDGFDLKLLRIQLSP